MGKVSKKSSILFEHQNMEYCLSGSHFVLDKLLSQEL